MTRLVAFGCSNTLGQALSDVWDFDKNGPNNVGASKYAWPQVLADKLNFECINNGIQGNGPKDTWWLIMNFPFKKNDIVAILWPNIFRTTLLTEPTAQNNKWYNEPIWPVFPSRWQNHRQIRGRHHPPRKPYLADKLTPDWADWTRKHSKYYIKHYQFDLDCILDLYVRADQTKYFLNKKNIKNIHYNMSYKVTVYEKEKETFHIKNVDMSFLKTCLLDGYLDFGLDNLHLGIKSHETIANEMYNEICIK